MAGLYIHIPFCVRKCLYCDFYSLPTGRGPVARRLVELEHESQPDFLDALAVELGRLPQGFKPHTVFIGGGTPTELSDEDFARLFELLGASSDLSGVSEFTCESNPGTLTPAKVDIMLAGGVSRVSLGVQSLTPSVLEFVGRIHSPEEAIEGYELLRRKGVKNINLDFMYGIPGQTKEMLKADLERAIELGPEHIACYCLIFEDGTPLTELRNKEAELARQEAQLSARYLPQHPRMLEISSQREANRERIRVEVQRGVERLASEVAVAKANADSLAGSLSQVQSRFRTEGTASIKLKALRSIAESSRAQYEALLARLKAVQGQEAFATPDAQIVSRANVPLTPSPSRVLVAGLALPMSVLIALVAVFAAEGLQPVVRTSEQVREVLGLPVLAVTPSLGTVSRPALAAAAIEAPGKPFARSLHAALLGLGLASDDVEPKAILVASAQSGEGKTTTAVGLARVAARYGRRTLLIDANFMQPAVAHAMGIDPTAGGLGAFLMGRQTLEAAVCRDDQTDLRVLVPGVEAVVGAELTPARLKALLAEARQRFDLIIVDTAPVQQSPDAIAMARLCDATVLVLQAGRTPRETAISVADAFASARVRLAGTVLTQARDVQGTW
jgi:capsular exopolysaccharide synthesis family protein